MEGGGVGNGVGRKVGGGVGNGVGTKVGSKVGGGVVGEGVTSKDGAGVIFPMVAAVGVLVLAPPFMGGPPLLCCCIPRCRCRVTHCRLMLLLW